MIKMKINYIYGDDEFKSEMNRIWFEIWWKNENSIQLLITDKERNKNQVSEIECCWTEKTKGRNEKKEKRMKENR